MSDNGILAIDNGTVISAFIEHSGIYTQNISKVDSAIQGSFIRTDDNQVLLVNQKILLLAEESFDELIRRCNVIKSV